MFAFSLKTGLPKALTPPYRHSTYTFFLRAVVHPNTIYVCLTSRISHSQSLCITQHSHKLCNFCVCISELQINLNCTRLSLSISLSLSFLFHTHVFSISLSQNSSHLVCTFSYLVFAHVIISRERMIAIARTLSLEDGHVKSSPVTFLRI